MESFAFVYIRREPREHFAGNRARYRETLQCYNRQWLSRSKVRGWIDFLVAARGAVGEWLSLVEHLVRDQGVGGSNPLSPTNLFKHLNCTSGFVSTAL